MKNEILRLQELVKKLENEIYECTIDVLSIGELAEKTYSEDGNAQHVSINVNDACDELYHKYNYRVRGYDAENLILGEVED